VGKGVRRRGKWKAKGRRDRGVDERVEGWGSARWEEMEKGNDKLRWRLVSGPAGK